MKTEQMNFWQGDFGQQYTNRNTYTHDQLDQVYVDTFGIKRSDLNNRFLKDLTIENLLEVGCNVGNQLRLLQSMGYENLFGIELQPYAVEKAKSLTKNINLIQGSAFDVPFKDGYFDLVFTSGVLIHISPKDIKKVIQEMYRLSKKYIWGFEYYSDEYKEVIYRGEGNALWKGDFANMFLTEFPDLKLVKTEKFPYLSSGNFDVMYLLEKV